MQIKATTTTERERIWNPLAESEVTTAARNGRSYTKRPAPLRQKTGPAQFSCRYFATQQNIRDALLSA
jgi:hypothetical protein